MLKPLRCDFMTGPLTEQNSMEILKNAFEQQTPSIHEMLYYKKNGTGIWLEVKLSNWKCHTFSVGPYNQVELIPVKNESNVVVLYICTFRDITSFKVKLKLLYNKMKYFRLHLYYKVGKKAYRDTDRRQTWENRDLRQSWVTNGKVYWIRELLADPVRE